MLVIALLAGRRRIAQAAMAVMFAVVIWSQAVPGLGLPYPYLYPETAGTLTVLGILALALTLVLAPSGWALLTRRQVLLTVVAATALTAAGQLDEWSSAPPLFDQSGLYEAAITVVIAFIAGLMLAVSPGSRRLLAVMGLPLYFVGISTLELNRLFPGLPLSLRGAFSPDILLVWLPLGAALVAGHSCSRAWC